jgi:hypothetical protein
VPYKDSIPHQFLQMPDQHPFCDSWDAAAQLAGSHRPPPDSRHRIVPFQRPSMTDSMASMGHWDISFFETGMMRTSREFTDKFVSTDN